MLKSKFRGFSTINNKNSEAFDHLSNNDYKIYLVYTKTSLFIAVFRGPRLLFESKLLGRKEIHSNLIKKIFENFLEST